MGDSRNISSIVNSRELAQNLYMNRPDYSECAYITKRPLSYAPWVNNVSDNSFLDKNNLELSHGHILFGNSGDNIGFGPEGLFTENASQQDYRISSPCLDGNLVRVILGREEVVSDFYDGENYNFFTNNCQKFTETVSGWYTWLTGSN